jgi:uroporphyrinogen-III decarboxylase
MSSRERVLAAINHQVPDRVPSDMGSTIMSGIMAHPLDRLRKHLGLEERPVKVYEVYQMLGEVEMDLVERLGIDVLPVEPPVEFFGLRRENYKPEKLWDGTTVLFPGQFNVEVDEHGDWILHEEGDSSKPVAGRMPKDGYYFDILSQIQADPNFSPPPLEEVKKAKQLTEKELEFMQQRAERLRRETDKALLLGSWHNFGLTMVGSIPDFLCLLLTDKQYIHDLFSVQTEVAIRNMEKVKQYMEDSIDIIGLDGTDYGSQKSELFNPKLFEELFVPFYRQQNDWVHRNTSWKTWKHTCGSVPNLIPGLIDSHMDILNPVQTSAAGMDPQWLKDTFGDDIVFWGGGVDTQSTFPFSSPEEVAQEVRERLDIFSPGGGFVFNPIHNIQQNTPPENIVAAYDTVQHYTIERPSRV